ncbi:MAG: hypothetical protein AAF518_13800 [Spirochaetota bacterium]
MDINLPANHQQEHNSTVHYHGHGVLENAASHDSISHVMGHELVHVGELKQEAFLLGGNLKYLDIELGYEFRDGKVVAVSGETTGIIEEIRQTSSAKAKQGDSILEISIQGSTFSKKLDAEDKNTENVLQLVKSRLQNLKKEQLIPSPYALPGQQNVAGRIQALEVQKQALELSLEK